jgi:hypothetical protein
MGVNSLMGCISATYTASDSYKERSVCIFEAHGIGHPAYLLTHPILDLAALGSVVTALLLHSDACDESI